MSGHNDPNLTPNEIELEKIIDRALGELHTIDHNDQDDQLMIEMEHAAALLDIAVAESNPIDMPDDFAQRLKSQVASYPAQHSAPAQSHQPDSYPFSPESQANNNPSNWVPWMVAAASLLIATVSILMPRGTQPPLDLDTQRLALIENTDADDLIQWNWISTEDSAVVGDVIGDVVWSNTLNKGYMRISGLAINDPSLEQYQLWIFDATRPTGDLPQFGEGLLTQRPVDGGVFDINETGEVIIEIDSKLAIQQAAAFAITVEQPGGVVVSDRSRVPLLALAP